MTAAKTVTLSNVGPISYLELPVPKDGGMVILKGRNGVGKSTALDTMHRAIDGEGKINVKDGAEEAEVDFLGVHIRARKKTKYAGCLEVESLEGKFSIADIINPGFADPVANDKRAILGILQVVGAKADASLFYDLVGGEANFKKFVTKDTMKETDLVSMAGKTKRNFEDSARDMELDVESWTAKATALKSALPPDSNSREERPVEDIEADLAEARTKSIEAHTERRSSLQRIEEFESKMLDFNNSSSVDPRQSVVDAKAASDAAFDAHKKSCDLVADLKQKLQEAEQQARLDQAASASAFSAFQTAEANAKEYAKLKEFLESGKPVEYPESKVAEADASVSKLQDALFACRSQEKTKVSKQEIADLESKIFSAKSTAETLRSAAKSVDIVLTEMLEKVSDTLKFEDDRLFVLTERGKTYFHDPSGTNGLSKGERTKVVVDIAAQAVGEGGIIVVDQDFTQDLDPIARQEVAEHARSRKVTIYTAMCTTDETIQTEVL